MLIMKKEYLKPEITIVTFSSSVHLMAGSGGPGANSMSNPGFGSSSGAPEFELENDVLGNF